jgi:hypothetical protein
MVDMNKRITAIGLTAGLLAGAGVGVLLQHSGGAGAAGGRSNFAPGTAPAITAPGDSIFGGSLPGADQGGPGVGGPDDGGPGDGGPGRGGFGANLDAVAKVLDMSIADLQTALQDGQTLAQIARAHAHTPNDVIDTLVAGVKAHFAADVASGEHTQAEADQFVAAFRSQISDFVNNGTVSFNGSVFPGPGGGIVGGVPGAGGFPGVGAPGGGGPSDGGPSDGGPNDGGPNDGGPIGGLPVTPTTVAGASI